MVSREEFIKKYCDFDAKVIVTMPPKDILKFTNQDVKLPTLSFDKRHDLLSGAERLLLIKPPSDFREHGIFHLRDYYGTRYYPKGYRKFIDLLIESDIQNLNWRYGPSGNIIFLAGRSREESRHNFLSDFEALNDSCFRNKEFFGISFYNEGIQGLIQEILEVSNLTPQGDNYNIYLFCGLSGAGKTTSMNHLAGYMKNTVIGRKVTTRELRLTGVDERICRIPGREIYDLVSSGLLTMPVEARGHVYAWPKHDIEAPLEGRADCFVECGDLELAMRFKEQYPEYTEIIAILPDQESLYDQLVKRYDLNDLRILEQGGKLSKKERHTRLDEVIKEYEKFKEILPHADYVAKEQYFQPRQRAIRKYILANRNSGILD